MKHRRKVRENDLTDRFLRGELEDAEPQTRQRFSARSRDAEASKMLQTALLRAEEQSGIDIESLPVGEVVQVYSLFSDVRADGRLFLCVVRKTLSKLSKSAMVVGDRVRFRDLGIVDEQGRPQAVIEQVLPRQTLLTRSDSFKAIEQQPIVANAQQMLIVASVREPDVRWGLIDRMIVAAQGGGLRPVVCLNKVDLETDAAAALGRQGPTPEEALECYRSLGITTLQTSLPRGIGLEQLKEILRGQTTVLAGHSGVGKSSLINAIVPDLELRTGAISNYTGKGRHTTTSARYYPLAMGGAVIDTPGVKLFGLWGIHRDNLSDYFPDVAAGVAPAWRRSSFQRIADSLSPA